jgi:dihydroorotate dehydrogenase (NAD+) catalytic subunit
MSAEKMQWFPEHPPIYDIHKTYQENVEQGPFFSGDVPPRIFPPKEKWIDFLGYQVASPLGVAAGPLLTSKWIALAGALGFDLPCYKTIRSRAHPAHPLPNMIYVDTRGFLSPQDSKEAIGARKNPPKELEDLAVTNSFGMPSQSPHFLMEDIPKANDSLKEGQVMIVSIVGTPNPPEEYLEDFINTAVLAKEAGAKIIEANFSCPNVAKKEGSLYMSPDLVYELGSAIAKAIRPIPLIIKVGIFPSKELMREVMIAAARAQVRAICGINTISRSVVTETGESALGPSRPTSGICGGPIRQAALSFIQDACLINKKEALDLKIMGVGGVTLPEHFDLFLEAGADIAMTATGMVWDPFLAARYHQMHNIRR